MRLEIGIQIPETNYAFRSVRQNPKTTMISEFETKNCAERMLDKVIAVVKSVFSENSTFDFRNVG